MQTDTQAATTEKAEEKKRRTQAGEPMRGIFEKVPGSGIWWIRFVDAEGKYRREKVGSKSAATRLYQRRKTQALEGVKLPAKLRRRVVPFSEIADDAISYIQKEYSRPADDVARIEVLKVWFAGRSAESITPDEIEQKLELAAEEKEWSASTRNHLPQRFVSRLSPRAPCGQGQRKPHSWKGQETGRKQ